MAVVSRRAAPQRSTGGLGTGTNEREPPDHQTDRADVDMERGSRSRHEIGQLCLSGSRLGSTEPSLLPFRLARSPGPAPRPGRSLAVDRPWQVRPCNPRAVSAHAASPSCSKPLMTCRPPAPPTVTPTPRKGTIAVHRRCPSRMWSRACRDDGAGVRGKTTTQGCARSQARMVVVSNLSARQPCDAVRSRMSPRLVSADELGRCGAKHGAGEQRVGAALASHGRSRWFEPNHAHQHNALPYSSCRRLQGRLLPIHLQILR